MIGEQIHSIATVCVCGNSHLLVRPDSKNSYSPPSLCYLPVLLHFHQLEVDIFSWQPILKIESQFQSSTWHLLRWTPVLSGSLNNLLNNFGDQQQLLCGDRYLATISPMSGALSEPHVSGRVTRPTFSLCLNVHIVNRYCYNTQMTPFSLLT